MIIPIKIAKKDDTFARKANFPAAMKAMSNVEKEILKRLKEGNWDPRNEIPDDNVYPGYNEIRVTIMSVLDEMGIKLVDGKDSNGRKTITMKLPDTKYEINQKQSEPLIFDIIMKEVLKKHTMKYGKGIKDLMEYEYNDL